MKDSEKSGKKEKKNFKTKTYEVPVSILRRWKLTPEDATVIKLALLNWSSKHKELESRKKSLLSRMKGDFFMVLYAPGGSVEVETTAHETASELSAPEGEAEPSNPSV